MGGYAPLVRVESYKKGTYIDESINLAAQLDTRVAGSEGMLTCKHSLALELGRSIGYMWGTYNTSH